ncbi:hypothetical protein K504DRAFT_511410 [Pleomassaria siparia CBS 279.74]|uniref:Uncharacterized protein n=1 Tax=Pleomassaria siparia CBS 279.74 TaxID=1314801 RepID=A0A6G1K538_9PLEO|nr:hypothetical protein K504DRAFT_511410 [Pleomassaria siparia CBS 279.74]
MEHQRCYIYAPPELAERSPKRQRTSEGNPQKLLRERMQTYREIWSHQEEKIQATLEEADIVTQEKIVKFVSAASQPEHEHSLAIPTGLVVVGPSIASHGPFFERLGRRIKEDTNSANFVLTSGESPNLKTFLKNLIKKATSRVEDDDDDDLRPSTSSKNGPKLLDFDLGHLQEWQNRNRVQNIVVTIQDSEAFDSSLLAEIVDLFYSWLDRLPFVLLFGIATSAESFEERLSGKSLRYLEGQEFDVTQSSETVEKLFSTTVASTDIPLRIGPNLSRRILERQRDHVQNVQDFSDGLKYAYMSHFYANHTSIFLQKGLSFKDVPEDVFDAVRTLPSFRRWIENLLGDRDTQQARKLLESDEFLFTNTVQQVQAGQNILSGLSGACMVLVRLRKSLQMTPHAPISSIWTRAASGDLAGAPLLRETMLLVKKISSDKFLQLLTSMEELDASAFSSSFTVDLDEYRQKLDELVTANDTSAPLRTQHDVRNDSLRTTVVAQKVLLSKHKAALSEHDKAYSELVTRFHDEMENYFVGAITNPNELLFSEILIYDLKSPHTEVFQPKPRFAIERALASPHDYLGCDCCVAGAGEDGQVSFSGTQPPTAILYQMYLESGAIINVSDLWSAFNAILGTQVEDSDTKTMALFQRSLAELRYLGFIKPSKKKTDHIAKTMWKGL